MPGNREMLSKQVQVTLSISDWLAFMGWSSAHLHDYSPNLIEQIIREIGTQIANG